jgi:hypothetical protein
MFGLFVLMEASKNELLGWVLVLILILILVSISKFKCDGIDCLKFVVRVRL